MTRVSAVVAAITAGFLCACGSSGGRAEEATGTNDKGHGAEASRGTELASAKLDDGRVVDLLAAGKPPYEGISPCLKIYGVGESVRQCGSAPEALEQSERDIVALTWARADRSAPLEVYGVTQPEVAKVILVYRAGGIRKRMPAVLLEMLDEEMLGRAHITEPFRVLFRRSPC